MSAGLSAPRFQWASTGSQRATVGVPFADLSGITEEVRSDVLRGWVRAIDTNGFIGGPAVEAFEVAFAAYTGTAECIGVANGTDALCLTLRALNIGPGDEVIVPTNTFVATAEAVVLAGATPRFVDVDDACLLIRPEDLAAAITPATRAVMVVHLYGQMADMTALTALADAAGIALIEDAAQAQGARWDGRPAGSFGVAGCFSFYPGKNLGAFGDAGAIVTSDAGLADRLRSLRDHGRVPGSHYDHRLIGTNSRLDAVQAVVLAAKLARLDSWNHARRDIAARYRQACEGTPVSMVGELDGSRGVYHLAVARFPDREAARALLAEEGVGTSIHYPTPCHQSAAYRDYHSGPLPVAEQAATEILSLPMFPHMSEAQVERVCEALHIAAELAEPAVAHA